MGSPFEGSPRAGVAEYVKGGMLYKADLSMSQFANHKSLV